MCVLVSAPVVRGAEGGVWQRRQREETALPVPRDMEEEEHMLQAALELSRLESEEATLLTSLLL